MALSRRTLLGAVLAAFAAAPLSPAAAASSPDRDALLAAFRQGVVGFDVLEVARRMFTEAGLTKWIPEVEALIGDRERHQGMRSLMLWDRDPAWGVAVSALMRRMAGDFGTKLAIRRLAKRVPTDAAALQAFVERAIRDWFGIDVPALRDAAAALPDDGLLLVVGPPTTLWETVSSAVREPLVRYLELVHGRRATVWVSQVDPKRALLEALLDPAHEVVVFVGHGHWTGFSLSGLTGDPTQTLLQVLTNVRAKPRKYVPLMVAGDVRRATDHGVGYARDELREEQLAALVDQVGVAPKALVVRHTCGHGRYRAEDASLLWELLPDDLAPRLAHRREGVSAASPEEQGKWEAPLEAWLADKRVSLAEQPALGTCLVASPDRTRGYEGDSWLPHFVEEPIPAHRPPHPWPTPADAPAQAEAAAPEVAAEDAPAAAVEAQ